MSRHLTVDKSSSSASLCLTCKHRIASGLLRVTKYTQGLRAKQYHLACFRPAEPVPVSLSKHVTYRRLSEERDIQQLRDWVDRWNRQFTAPASSVSRVNSAVGPVRRLLLEVFQYLDLKDLELVAALICRDWLQITRDNDLWRPHYLSSFPPSEETNYRFKFMEQHLERCWLCKTSVPFEQVKMICPWHKRPLCLSCSQQKNGHIVPISLYFSQRHIALSLISRLNIPHFLYKHKNYSYQANLAAILIPYAEQRKAALLTALRSRPEEAPYPLLQRIAKFNLKSLYCNYYSRWSYGYLEKGMAQFCGRDEAEEDFDRSVADFLLSMRRLLGLESLRFEV